MSCNPAALTTRVDWRAWAGVNVMTINGTAISLPAWTGSQDGVFFDVVDALAGRGQASAESMVTQAGARWNGAGTLTMGIDGTTGRLYLQSSTDDFQLNASADNTFFGFAAAGHGTVGGVAPFRRVAPLPFTQGPNGARFTSNGLLIQTGVNPQFAVGNVRWFPNVIHALRARGLADLDDTAGGDCLEAIIQAAMGLTHLHVGLDTDGKVVIAWTASAWSSAPTWNSTSFRDALGFTGNETVALGGGGTSVRYIKAARVHPKAIALQRPLARHDAAEERMGAAASLTDGGASTAEHSRLGMRRARFYIGGPASALDTHRHWMRRVWPGKGGPLTLYPQGLAEPRRWLDPYDVTADQPAYSLLYTSGGDGYDGRFKGRLPRDEGEVTEVRFPGQMRLETSVDITLRQAED